MVGILRTVTLCSMLAAVGVASASQTQPLRAPEKRVAKQSGSFGAQEPTGSKEDKTATPNVTVIVKQEQPTSKKPDEGQAADEENTRIQRRLANLTTWLVVAAFITCAVLIWQAIETRRAVEATKRAAEAAKASADAAIASERAWVMVSLEKVPGVGFLSYGPGSDAKGIHHEAGVRISCICSNQGKTPAKILEKRARLILVTPDNPLPLTPNLEIEIQDPVPHYLQAGGEPHKKDWRLDTQYSVSGNGGDIVTFFVVYGVVKYRHLFSEQIVHTTFGYRVTLDSFLERLIDYPKYNENT